MAGRNLVPMTDNESDLGSPTKRWKDVYVTNIDGYVPTSSTTTTPTASSIPVADANGDIDSGWIKDATDSVKGVVELATSAETTTATDTTRAVTPAGFLAGLRGHLLGTVSQSGGIPTGAVIESGSNTNGEYVKFANGTMICSILKTVTDQAINAAYGSLYTGTRDWTFPAVFSASPVTTVGLCRWGTGASWGTISDNSATSATLRFFDIISRSTGTSFVYSATAIGWWF